MLCPVLSLADNDTIGSDTVISQQTFFEFSGINNRIAPAAVMGSGFTFNDSLTTVTYDSDLFVAGGIFLNGGLLILEKDLVLGAGGELSSPGRVQGQDHAIIFPCDKEISFDSAGCAAPFTTIIQGPNVGNQINAVDVAISNRHIAVTTDLQGGGTELRIYTFDGASLTLSASWEFGATVNICRWHPSEFYLALGRINAVLGEELHLFSYVPSSSALGRTDTQEEGADVVGLGWHPDGNFLAVGRAGSPEIQLYSFDKGTGLLGGPTTTINITGNSKINDDALAWSSDGTYLAAGTRTAGGGGGAKLFIYSFNGGSFVEEASLSVSENINSLDWSPTDNYLAAGLDANTTTRMYFFDEDTSLITEVNSIAVNQNTKRAHWNSTGCCLATAINGGNTNHARVYFFDRSDESLHEIDTLTINQSSARSVRWARDGTYLVVGQADGNLLLASFVPTNTFYVFNNASLCFSGDACINVPLRFEGNCIICGKGTVFDVTNASTIEIAAGACLSIRNLFMRGIGNNAGRFLFADNNGQVRLSNVDIELVNTVTTTIGNIYVEGPSTWFIKHFDWVFEQVATLTVDGVTLWKDGINTLLGNIGSIDVGVYGEYLDKVLSGTIKSMLSRDDIRDIINGTDEGVIVDIPHQDIDTILNDPLESDFLVGGVQAKTMIDNLYLAPNRKLRVLLDSVLSGSRRYIHFAHTKEPVLLIDSGVTLSLQQVTLKDFLPSHVRYGDSNSRLFFGPGTVIELAECSELKATVGGIEQSITWTFKTDATKEGSIIKGFGNRLLLPPDLSAALVLEPHATLTLHHMLLTGLGGMQTGPSLLGSRPHNLRLLHSSSRLALKETELMLTGNYSFTEGLLDVIGDTKISGTYTFAYRSPQISRINKQTRLLLDSGLTLSYDAIPGSALGEDTKRKIVFDDSSSVLYLRGATVHATHTGLLLENGTLRIEDDTNLRSEALSSAERNVLVETSLNVEILADATLALQGLVEVR